MSQADFTRPNYNATDEDLLRTTEGMLQAYVALMSEGTQFAGTHGLLMRDVILPGLTAATATHVLADFLVDLYAEQMTKNTFNTLFTRGYRLSANDYGKNFHGLAAEIATYGVQYSDTHTRYAFYDEWQACSQILGNTHLASGLADQLLVVAFFVSHFEQYRRAVQHGDVAWGAHLYPLMLWFMDVSAAVVALREMQYA